jgi:hypothetical protein
VKGSPGKADPDTPAPTILLNEIVAHTDYSDPNRPEVDSNDWIELFNVTGTDITLNNWYLSDDPGAPAKWLIPTVTIPARGWITFSEIPDFHDPVTTGFGLNKAGEQVLLSYLPGTPDDRVADAISFKGQENDFALARYPDGGPFWQTTARTRDTANTPPASGLRFSEIMYHPPDLAGGDNTRDKYIELCNPTSADVLMQNDARSWRLDGGVQFTFPPNTTISRGSAVLVVSFSPGDSASSNAFRATWGITSDAITLFGPYAGKLSNRSERIALERPQAADAAGDPPSWVIVDEVIYGNEHPWPAEANGSGDALDRRSFLEAGVDPDNWHAAAPSPGSVTFDGDVDGMPDDWEANFGFDPNNPADAALDADKDGLTNLQEHRAGTNPRDARSVLGLSVVAWNNDIVLEFTAMAGRSYSIQCCDSIQAGVWQTLTNVSAALLDRQIVIPDPSPVESDTRYYRLAIP